MDKNRYQVVLTVDVESFDSTDAQIIINDYLGPGVMDSCLTIVSTKIKQL
jgi:hypothetical protein